MVPASTVDLRVRILLKAKSEPKAKGCGLAAYSIASLEIRFSEKSIATAFLSSTSGRNTMRWLLIIAEGEKSLAAIASCE